MWIFCKLGFFSVVEDRDVASKVLVRARAREDLERLVADMKRMPGGARRAWTIYPTPHADYPFRIYATKKQVSAWLSKHALEDVNYDNFKAAVPERADVYHRVWAVLRSAFASGPFAPLRKA